MLNKYRAVFLLFIIYCVAIVSCTNHDKKKLEATDTPLKGTINISVDESFRPVIEQAIKVYEGSFSGTHIIAHYKPESECFKDFYLDSSNRMIIVTRPLNYKENKFYTDSLGFRPATNMVAWDAITVVLHKDNTDTLYTMESLQQLLQGKNSTIKEVVFDGMAATSTVHFAIDSILHGANFDTSVVRAVANSKEVLNYIASHKDAVGLVGISWIGNPEDTAQVNMLKKVKFAYVQCKLCDSTPYVKPSQEGIVTKRYPLVRGLYYILKENYSGLGSGFGDFLYFERGQLIFRRAYLGPRMDFRQREVSL
jgi:phosphate transport system substrate-binding protein